MEATKVQLRANRASVANYGYHCSMFIDGYKQGCQDGEREQKDSLTKKMEDALKSQRSDLIRRACGLFRNNVLQSSITEYQFRKLLEE